jgi:hypothetical protein
MIVQYQFPMGGQSKNGEKIDLILICSLISIFVASGLYYQKKMSKNV